MELKECNSKMIIEFGLDEARELCKVIMTHANPSAVLDKIAILLKKGISLHKQDKRTRKEVTHGNN